MNSNERPVLLIICDISGYTRYMVSNKISLEHSQLVITELIQAIVDEIKIPLHLAKLEGDAVFCYVPKESAEYTWQEIRFIIGIKLLRFFELFSAKLESLLSHPDCECLFCKNLDQLKLKIIVHSGTAMFMNINEFNELGGLDVIILHRLLKNSLPSKQYILLSESAFNDITFPGSLRFVPSAETYDAIGQINTYVYFPDAADHNRYMSTRSQIIRRIRAGIRGLIVHRQTANV
ncbi:MAG: DUF2652 domain-containing protein [Candidatus Auribacterota bacterium]